MSADIVLQHSSTVTIHLAQDALRVGVPVVGGLAEPDKGL
jgi:hypothetical protein